MAEYMQCSEQNCTALQTMYCTALQTIDCTALETKHCRQCTVLHCRQCTVDNTLYCTALYCTALYCTALYCTALYCTGDNALLSTVSHWTYTTLLNIWILHSAVVELPTIHFSSVECCVPSVAVPPCRHWLSAADRWQLSPNTGTCC